jgi:hypothetical protein
MRGWFVTFCLLWMASPLFAADQHPACLNPRGTDQSYAIDELFTIARSCKQREVADLFYNRAQHRQLLEKYRRFENSLIHYGDRDHLAYIESYRIYIGLAEAFSLSLYAEDNKLVIARLNRVYEQSGEIAEMRFKGYDLIADRLERKLRL